MGSELIPYSFESEVLPAPPYGEEIDGIQGVFFTVSAEIHEALVAKIEGWFEGSSEVTLIDYGITDKQHFGYVVLEWEGYAVNPLFLAILRDEEAVVDYTVYTRADGEVW